MLAKSSKNMMTSTIERTFRGKVREGIVIRLEIIDDPDRAFQ